MIDVNTPFDKAHLIRFANWTYGVTGSHDGQDEHLVIETAREYADSHGDPVRKVAKGMLAVDPFLLTLNIMLGSHDGHAQIIGFARWAHGGFPCVAMSHKFAAALLVTTASAECIDAVRPPFDSFVIEVPDSLLFTSSGDTPSEHSPIRFVLVHKLYNPKLAQGWAWAYTTYAANGMSTFRYGVTAEELLPPDLDTSAVLSGGREGNDDRTPFSFDLTTEDKRTAALIGRLIINTCLAFSDPTNVKERGDGRKSARKASHGGRVRKHDEPIARNYMLTRPIQHDFRDVVSNYLRGERKSPSVQWLVRGHFKTQHYGPKNSLLKTIWREPYWSGKEDAPIAVRPIVLGTTKEWA